MTIKPGTQIKFGYDGSENPKHILDTRKGILKCEGTEDLPILICKDNSTSIAGVHSNSELKYTRFIDIMITSGELADHCDFIYTNSVRMKNNERGMGISLTFNSITNTKIINQVQTYNYNDRSTYGISLLYNASNCLLNGIGAFDSPVIHVERVISNSAIINYKQTYYTSQSNIKYPYNEKIVNNAILNNYKTNKCFIPNYENLSSNQEFEYANYFGTDNAELIGITNEIAEEYPDIYKSYFTLDSPEVESIYPFMTEAYVTDEKGECIENAYPGQTLMVHVKFNRDMATDIQPDVTVGIDHDQYQEQLYFKSYLDYTASGDWISSREWAGRFVIADLDSALYANDWFYNLKSGIETSKPNLDDTLYIRSEGAVAADDRWLVTGNDGGRFGFNVIRSATVQTVDTEITKLQGKDGAGFNQFTWSQDKMATLAGYNIYRSVGDSNNFTKLNKSLLSNEDLQYTDTDVVTGQKYYYYFTTVDTDFNESKPSNTVECTPLDGEKPQIIHTPVTYSKPEQTISINANVTDNVKVDSVNLFYKYSDEAEWNSDSMRNTSGSNYQKVLSAYEVRNG